MQQICLGLENNRIFSMMHNIFCLQNQSYFSSCGSLTGSFCPKSLCSLHKRRLHSVVLSHPFPLVRSTTRPTTNIHMHTQTRARTHTHTCTQTETTAHTPCTLNLDWQIPSEISSELETTAICLSLSCTASITICYQLQKCGCEKMHRTCVHVQKARGKCKYLRNSWGHSWDVCQAAWPPAEATVSARLMHYDTDSYFSEPYFPYCAITACC